MMIKPDCLKVTDLANRTYWDVFGYESESLDLEQKLINLGHFVYNGGSIASVIDIYTTNIDDSSQLDAIQWAIFYYLEYLMNARNPFLHPYKYNPTVQRIMCLDKDELLELLERELLRCFTIDIDGHFVISGVSQCNDQNLDAIERRHWNNNPDESFLQYSSKSRRWDNRLAGLWRKGH